MIDLHIHSKYSDGTDSLVELLKKCEEQKLTHISITDHDEVKIYFELETIDLKKYFSGKIIVGAEFRSIYQMQAIEILAYGFNPNLLKDLNKEIREARVDRIAKQEMILEHLKKIGKEIGLKFNCNIKIDENNIFASNLFETEIFKYEKNLPILKANGITQGDKIGNFYRQATNNPKNIFYRPKKADIYLSPDQVIKAIHNAGGLAFLAHPLIYAFKDSLKEIEEIIKTYPEFDGIECFYPTFSKEDNTNLINLAKKYHKYICGGSDYHGDNKEYKLGKPKIDYQMVRNWLEKV